MRLKLAAALALAALAVALDPALAKSSLGIGSAEVSAQPSGPFAGLFTDIAVYQRAFFTSLRHALVSLKSGPSAMPFL
ncbi:MAG TPA: hypothetical protein VFJ13_07840, partial [Paracoccaceae bacterium]|nr:hypothetical protein [Paracoccaceae bacterium]